MSNKKSELNTSADKRRRGRPPKLGAEQREQLAAITRERPSIAIDDIIAEFRKRTGIVLAASTVLKYLREAGVERTGLSKGAAARSEPASDKAGSDDSGESRQGQDHRYGYNESHRDDGDEERYPCGLTDAEWNEVGDLFEHEGPGRPPKYARRTMLDACVYVLRSGCSWRMLPKDFPPWQHAYGSFRRWSAKGLFETMYDRLREMWRKREERKPAPTECVIDAQSVKTSPQGGPKGYDAGKKVKGRKRNLIVDTLGLLLVVFVTKADLQDRDLIEPAVAMAKGKYPTIQKVYTDGGYAGKNARAAAEKHGIDIEVVRPPSNRVVGRWEHPDQLPLPDVTTEKRAFEVLPKRWIVERNNAWNERPRRMNRDHDRRLDVSAAWIWLTEGRMLLRRLVATA